MCLKTKQEAQKMQTLWGNHKSFGDESREMDRRRLAWEVEGEM